jgi:anti-sigma28 factor (negative regulator of flagellin synthesis)
MRISNSDLSGVTGPGASAAQETQRSGRKDAAASGQAAQGGDRVEFSSGLGRLASAISTYGGARAAQVQTLAAQYQSGAYQVDSLATSRAMVADALSGSERA